MHCTGVASVKQLHRQITWLHDRSTEPYSVFVVVIQLNHPPTRTVQSCNPLSLQRKLTAKLSANCGILFTVLVKQASLNNGRTPTFHRVSLRQRCTVVLLLSYDLIARHQLACIALSSGWGVSSTLRATQQAADAADAHSTHCTV